ncbi:MAG: hypothetical protein Satyrvirus9_9 [Satyrvirus sp.]|uniref:Uncharacterized protein n=1 Tax=Satyrvirus sp. TaxID=2487771 RepID=A0A3G5AHD1_9VIRU|nr:MAG: hypothetical protein Satyrvirus9_9 [Satyrvirus sp.]
MIAENKMKNTDISINQTLYNVIKSLDKIDLKVKQMIFDMSHGMTEMEIIKSFNEQASYLFNLISTMTKRMGNEDEYKVSGYKTLFDNATKINAKLPVDKFTLVILEYAAEIYAEDENCFLNMTIPDKKCKVGNEFDLIRSENFKKLWKILGKDDKRMITDNVILLTTYAHAYLYKTILKNKLP